jgi:DNA relaxase NicK
MQISIDYLSFTIPFEQVYDTPNYRLGAVVEERTNEYMGQSIDALLDDQSFSLGKPRAPYSARWGRADGGVSIFAGAACPHILVEVTGKGCETLRRHEALQGVLSLVQDRSTRIDIACDILCDTSPHIFAQKRDVARFKTTSDMRSDTGDTFYVGSFKSDRFARVYRFAEPHPRAALLRVEHVYRREYAKKLAAEILTSGLAAANAGCGMAFGWSNPLWDTNDITPAEVHKGQKRKSGKDTVRWLYGTVTNSIVKQIKAGQLDLEDYIEHIRKECSMIDKRIDNVELK